MKRFLMLLLILSLVFPVAVFAADNEPPLYIELEYYEDTSPDPYNYYIIVERGISSGAYDVYMMPRKPVSEDSVRVLLNNVLVVVFCSDSSKANNMPMRKYTYLRGYGMTLLWDTTNNLQINNSQSSFSKATFENIKYSNFDLEVNQIGFTSFQHAPCPTTWLGASIQVIQAGPILVAGLVNSLHLLIIFIIGLLVFYKAYYWLLRILHQA